MMAIGNAACSAVKQISYKNNRCWNRNIIYLKCTNVMNYMKTWYYLGWIYGSWQI